MLALSSFQEVALRPRWPGTSVKTAKMPKVLRERAKGVLGLLSESPKTVSCTLRNCVLGCFARCETAFARCERLFWDSRPRETIHFSTLLKHFWAFWLFWYLYQASGVAKVALNLSAFRCLPAHSCSTSVVRVVWGLPQESTLAPQ